MRAGLGFVSRKKSGWLALAVTLAWPGVPAPADEVLLRGGGKVTGVIVERTEARIVIESGPGRVTLPMSRVVKVVESRSALEVWQERAASLAPGDADGWAALALWAAERDLGTQSRDSWRRVLAVRPGHPEANAALGRERLDGQWLERDEAYRARGYVSFEGRWVTPAEHEAVLRERAAESADARDLREAQARAREARATEAEARAREAESRPAEFNDGGIPYGWGWGGGYLLPPPPIDDPGLEPLPPPPVDPPRHSTPPSSINDPADERRSGAAKAAGVSQPKRRN